MDILKECLIPNRLYYGRNLYKKDLTDDFCVRVDYIFNVRPENKNSHDYIKKAKEKKLTVYAVPIVDIIKKKDMKRVRDICELLVGKMRFENKTVYVHCHNGKQVSPFIAMIMQYWYYGDPKFDPVKDIRQKFNFEVVQSRDQRDQLDEFKEMIQKTMLWFKIRKKKIKN